MGRSWPCRSSWPRSSAWIPRSFTLLYQDTAAANWDMGSSGSQTTFNSGRAILAAAADVRDQLLDAAAAELEVDRERPGARGWPGPSEGLDRSIRFDRRSRGRPDTIHGKGSGEVPEAPTGDTGGCVGPFGERDLPGSAPDHAGCVRVDRETGVVARAEGCRGPRLRCDPQPDGRGRPGDRRRRDGGGPGALGGTQLDDEGRQQNPYLLDYKLITCSDAPRDRGRLGADPDRGCGPRGSKGVGEPPQVPTAGAIANAIAKVLGTQVRAAPDDARAHLGRVSRGRRSDEIVRVRDHARGRVRRARARSSAGGRRHRPGGRGAGRARPRCQRRSSRSIGSTIARGIVDVDGGLRLGRAGDARGDRRRTRSIRERFTALADASGDRRLARHPGARHDRRQRHERLAGDGHGRAAAVLRRDGRILSRRRQSARAVSMAELWTGPGTTAADAERAARSARRSRRRRPTTGLRVRPPRVPTPDGDRGRRGDRCRDASTPVRSPTPGSPSPRWRLRSRRVVGGREAALDRHGRWRTRRSRLPLLHCRRRIADQPMSGAIGRVPLGHGRT